ncbi:hypothetical protein [Mycobacterium sp. ITM-2016-00318]|uniref:hypothetical protein n=1 Tax=Mycobacterium sp. ITM-2016-00318 TaxID=2099693 RepID=UPI000CF8A000|nr:hypothetical protein [Mycobacterium sp. ITM-2016-00318]WNG92193.1 hypothetical protein C6A82_022675 [Mycobacterium sp. ITM-2016-00318]
MSYAGTSVAPGSFPGVRRRFTTGVAVAGAGILALGLVVVPPDFDDARTDLRTVQYASLALPSALPSPAEVERFLTNVVATQARKPTSASNGDISGITTTSTTSPETLGVTVDPSTSTVEVNNADVGSALGLNDLVSIPAFVLAAAFVAFFFGVAIPAGLVFGFIGYNVIDPILNLLGAGGTTTSSAGENLAAATLAAGDKVLTADAGTLPEPDSGQVNNAALAETPTGGSILDPILPIIGPLILFAPLFIILIPVLPLLLPGAIFFWIQSAALSLSELISPPPDPAAAPSAIVEANAAVASDRLPSDYGLDALTTKHQPKGTPGTEKATEEAPPAVAAAASSSAKEQTPTESTASAGDVVKPAKEIRSPESQKPAIRPTKNSSVARGSTEGSERAADPVQGRSTTKSANGGKKAESQGASAAGVKHPSRDGHREGASTSNDKDDAS